MLPTFVIIGAQKAATTTLWHQLSRHPQIFMCGMKETDFFIAEKNWGRGLAWYESLFNEAPSGAVGIGEASPNYTMFPAYGGVPGRMAEVMPSARLIYVVRDPVERMRSGYLHALASGAETLSIDEALLERPHFLDTSRYAMQIDQYLEHFDRDQLLILVAEEFAADPGGNLDRVLEFLGLAGGWRPPDLDRRHHETSSKRVPRNWARLAGGAFIRLGMQPGRLPPNSRFKRSRLTTRILTPEDGRISNDVRQRLQDRLRPDVERLRAYLGPDFEGWGLLG